MKTRNGNNPGVSSPSGMSLERFAALAEAYGGDIDRWPEAERFAALSLAGRSEEARTLLADAHGLDFLLSRIDAPPDPSPGLRERMASLDGRAGPGLDVSESSDPVAASAASTRRAGLFSAVRSNALMLSIVANLVLAGVAGGLWIAPLSAPGTAPGTAYAYVELEDALSEELGDFFVFDDESNGLSPVGEFGEELSEDLEIASWPEANRPSDGEISAI